MKMNVRWRQRLQPSTHRIPPKVDPSWKEKLYGLNCLRAQPYTLTLVGEILFWIPHISGNIIQHYPSNYHIDTSKYLHFVEIKIPIQIPYGILPPKLIHFLYISYPWCLSIMASRGNLDSAFFRSRNEFCGELLGPLLAVQPATRGVGWGANRRPRRLNPKDTEVGSGSCKIFESCVEF